MLAGGCCKFSATYWKGLGQCTENASPQHYRNKERVCCASLHWLGLHPKSVKKHSAEMSSHEMQKKNALNFLGEMQHVVQ